MKTTQSNIFILFACILFLYPRQAASQIELGTAGDIIFYFDEMKVFRTVDDYTNNNFVISDNMKKDFFMKDKQKVLDVKDCWGYAVDYNSATYLFRLYEKGTNQSLMMAINGTICLYMDATPFYNPKKNQLYLLLYHTSTPVYFSVGLDGVIEIFNKANMSAAVTDDKEFLEQVDNIKNVEANEQDYIYSRIHAVESYNKRHPTGKDESDLFIAPNHHEK